MPEARALARALARLVGGPALARVRGVSMMPTLREGQLVAVADWSTRWRSPSAVR